MGTWAIGGAEESWGLVDDRESIAAIHHAIELGINLIDTAPIYGLGHSEDVVGKAILGQRDRVVLATKCGLLFPRSNTEPPHRCLSSESVIRECEQSLRRLRTDYIDVYQCHWPDPLTPIRESMEALVQLLEQQKIRAIGLSNFSCEEVAAAREFGPVHCLQVPFSMLQTRASQEHIPFCDEHGIGVLAYSPLARGLLTGKFRVGDTLTGIRARDSEFLGERFRRNIELVERLREIATACGRTVAQLALNWTAAYPGVTALLFGAKRPSQVVENAGGLGWTLSEADRQRIDQLLGGPARAE